MRAAGGRNLPVAGSAAGAWIRRLDQALGSGEGKELFGQFSARLARAVAFIGFQWLVVAFGAASAGAYGYTTVNAPTAGGGEESHLQIVSGIYASYGGSFVADGLGFTNASAGITVKRVYDFHTSTETLDILLSDETTVDQIWSGGVADMQAMAEWAGNTQSGGWNQGGLGTAYYELVIDLDIGGPPVNIAPNGTFLWGAQSGGNTFWSLSAENLLLEDHMVSYFVEGIDIAGIDKAWLLFWEDSPLDTGDGDYNDFTIQVTAIPEPGTALLVGPGLMALALLQRRGRRRSH